MSLLLSPISEDSTNDTLQGAGEAIRGTANSFADEVTNKGTATDAAAQTKNQNIAERGVDEMEHGHYHGTGAGVTPADTSREKVNRTIQGER